MKNIKFGMQFLLVAFFISYLFVWFSDYRDYLFNVSFQNDDARTILFPMHHYDHPPQLLNDPLAEAYSKSNPPAFKMMYQFLMQFMDLFQAAKSVQFLALASIFFAALFMIYKRPKNWELSVLYLFLILHTPAVMDRLAGGLVRSFGFPSLFIWGAGWLSDSYGLRVLGAVMSALLYPSTMLMIMVAEFLMALLHLLQKISWKKEAGIFLLSLVLYLPFMLVFGSLGQVYTLEQAISNPAFGHSGLLGFTDAIPFLDPLPIFVSHFLKPLSVDVMSLSSGVNLIWVAFLLVLFLAIFFGKNELHKKQPWVPIFMAACFILYIAGRHFAFSLYTPERFFNFGMVAAGIFWILSVFKKMEHRPLISRFSILILMGTLLFFGGKGTQAKTSVTINNQGKQPLYSYISQLPSDVMIAAHPEDSDDVPFWAARSSIGGYERTFLWIVDLFEKRTVEIKQMLGAFYATDFSEIDAFNQKYSVTHWLVKKDYFGEGFQSKAKQGEPFGSYVRQLLASRSPANMIFANPPPQAIVFQDEQYWLLDMSLWKK